MAFDEDDAKAAREDYFGGEDEDCFEVEPEVETTDGRHFTFSDDSGKFCIVNFLDEDGRAVVSPRNCPPEEVDITEKVKKKRSEQSGKFSTGQGAAPGSQ